LIEIRPQRIFAHWNLRLTDARVLKNTFWPIRNKWFELSIISTSCHNTWEFLKLLFRLILFQLWSVRNEVGVDCEFLRAASLNADRWDITLSFNGLSPFCNLWHILIAVHLGYRLYLRLLLSQISHAPFLLKNGRTSTGKKILILWIWQNNWEIYCLLSSNSIQYFCLDIVYLLYGHVGLLYVKLF
jgi:hypothetical protein